MEGTHGSRHSARSRATGEEATTSAWRPCPPPRASEDGRGPRTSLERAVPAHFGLTTPSELAEGIHTGRIEQRRVIELAPLVLAEAVDDAVAAEIVGHLASEVVALARVALTRLELTQEPVEVLLGGGVLQDVDGDLLAMIDSRLARSRPERHRQADRVRRNRRCRPARARRARGRPGRAGEASR